LIARAQGGDPLAFEELARAHWDRLLAVAWRLVGDRDEAEDVLPDALLRAWRGIEGFRGSSTFATWLHRIVVNEAMRCLSKRATPPRPLDDLRFVADEQRRPSVAEAVRTLPRVYRDARLLRDVDGLSTREAAALIGVGEAVLKRRLHVARLILRGKLERA
jgi:RNA polymerase sigma-70 factor, ECF subfamily